MYYRCDTCHSVLLSMFAAVLFNTSAPKERARDGGRTGREAGCRRPGLSGASAWSVLTGVRAVYYKLSFGFGATPFFSSSKVAPSWYNDLVKMQLATLDAEMTQTRTVSLLIWYNKPNDLASPHCFVDVYLPDHKPDRGFVAVIVAQSRCILVQWPS
jgi:hypothetical protein